MFTTKGDTLQKPPTASGSNSRQAAVMAKRRASARDLVIPDPESQARRDDLGNDDAKWLQFYLPDVFYNPFTADQEATIEQCANTLRYGAIKCKAAPRGDGKSSIVKYLCLKYALYRQVAFPLVIAGTFTKAMTTTKSLRRKLASRELKAPLWRDFPLECLTAQHVDPWPSRARNVTGNGGRRIHVEWGTSEGYFVLPTWEEDEPLGPIIQSLGYSSDALQGCNIYDRRPDFVMLDDLDSRDSLASEQGKAADKIEDCIEKTIAGLAGPSRRLGKFMLCTITSEKAAAFKYSDPKQKPAWNGERVSAITKWPDRQDMWEQYIALRNAAASEEPPDPHARGAHAFYLDNRDAMDAGAEVSNPHNFDPETLPDGSQKQVSSLQRCYDYIADNGRDSFDTEHQNAPKKVETLFDKKVETATVAACVGDLERRIVSESTEMVCRGVDVRKIELHHVTLTSEPGTPHRIADYDLLVHGNSETTVEQAEVLILDALHAMADEWEQLTDQNGTKHTTDLTLIDKGWVGNWEVDGQIKTWATQPVETFCMNRSGGLRRWLPAKGQPRYKSPAPTDDNIIGDHWHINRAAGKERGCTEVIWDATHWHQLTQDLFLLSPSDSDRFELFVPGSGMWTNHKAFSEHIASGSNLLAEQLESGGVRKRRPRFVRDHWWDSAAMALVAQSVETWMRKNLKPPPPRRKAANQQQYEEIGRR